GVSLHTIQRVERYGTASGETLMSLAAVFEIEQKSLVVEVQPEIIAPPGPATYSRLVWLLVLSAVLGGIVGGLGMYLLMS
ncbi:MAG: XRE family transcriptional regulator, partial [Psychrosphaera sp.]|nr:XRE family transcriptional regulator [Psychrosphaera sp.]